MYNDVPFNIRLPLGWEGDAEDIKGTQVWCGKTQIKGVVWLFIICDDPFIYTNYHLKPFVLFHSNLTKISLSGSSVYFWIFIRLFSLFSNSILLKTVNNIFFKKLIFFPIIHVQYMYNILSE